MLVIVIPMGLLNLDDNIVIQIRMFLFSLFVLEADIIAVADIFLVVVTADFLVTFVSFNYLLHQKLFDLRDNARSTSRKCSICKTKRAISCVRGSNGKLCVCHDDTILV